MNKLLSISMIVALFCAVFSSCMDDEETPPKVPYVRVADAHRNLTFVAAASDKTIDVNTNRELTATSTETWCTPTIVVNDDRSIGLKFAVIANEEEQSRKATVTLTTQMANTDEKTASVAIEIEQAAADAKGKLWDACESIEGWSNWGVIELDPDAKKGDYCISANPPNIAVFIKECLAFNTEITVEKGIFAFWLYVSDVSAVNWDIGPGVAEIELSSAGQPDVEETHWYFDKSLNLQNGWNHLELRLADCPNTPLSNLSAINYLRIYHTQITGPVVMKIDDLRFYNTN